MGAEKFRKIDAIFHPRSVAIIGASKRQSAFYVETLLASKLRESVFLINPRHKKMLGQKCYSSVLDVPDPVDYAIVAVAANQTLSVIEECINKKVKTVHIFSSGFSETGEIEGKKLEEELAKIAKGKIRLIGPNCMGIYCPESGLCFSYDLPKESGPVAFISQSGAQAVNFVLEGRLRNFRFSKVISYGNAVDLDFIDFVEYLGDDPKTKVIAVYLEGVRKTENLLQVLKNVTCKKPVIALKGGITREGARAASSHTGSLAGSSKIWDAFFKQTSVVQVKSFEEMSDTVLAFVTSSIPKGRGITIISTSGGASVVQTDACIEIGLELPVFNEETIGKLRDIIPIAGTSIRNPLDIWPAFHYGNLPNAMEIAASDYAIHSLILEIQAEEFRAYNPVTKKAFKNFIRTTINACRHIRDHIQKPIMICLPPSFYTEVREEFQRVFQKNGFPTYSSIKRAGRAIFNCYKYHYNLTRDQTKIKKINCAKSSKHSFDSQLN